MRRCICAARRALMAAVLVATVGIVVAGFGGSPPAGATTVPTGSISATSSPPVPSTGSGVAAGSLTVTLSSGTSLPSGGELALSVTASSGVVHWTSYSVSVSSGISYTSTLHVGNALDIHLGAKTPSDVATIYVTGIKFTTTAAQGAIDVHATLNGITFSPSSAKDAIVEPTPPAAPTMSIASTSRPQVDIGASSAAAADWTVTMTGDSATGSGWAASDVLTVTVGPPSGTNCAGAGYLYFASVPTVVVGGSAVMTSTPAISASLSNGAPCTAAQPNELKLTFTAADYFEASSPGTVTMAISNIRYAVGSTKTATGTGDVLVSASFSATPSSVDSAGASNGSLEVASPPVGTQPNNATQSTGSTQPTPGATPMKVEGDTPPVRLAQDAFDASISAIDVFGSTSTPLPQGYVCLSLSDGMFNTGAAPAVAVAAGNGSVDPTLQYGGQVVTGASSVEFEVSKASTTAAEYSISGLAVDGPTTAGPVTVTVTYGASSTCAHDTKAVGSATAFSVVATQVTRLYGSTPDATAAAELEHQFDAEATACPGRPGARPVVLATDSGYPDALSSAYLASSLGTGELLTPTGSLSAATAAAIRLEGITEVYIVGGSLAVSNSVSQELGSMLAYDCGGSTPLTSAGPVHMEVTRIAGTSEYQTAEWVAEYPTAGTVGLLDVAGAYAGTDQVGGSGKYNDTAGNGSAVPATASDLPTAIVATGHSFQDAESASVLSYADRLPILLTTPTSLSPQVSSVISELGIKQVIVIGGPLAVSDGTVSSLESLGLSVLRIAGQSATDTAVQLAQFEMASKTARLGAGWAGSGGVTVARADYFTDGLAGAVVAAGAGRQHTHVPEPLLLCTNPSTVGQYLSRFLSSAGRTGIDGDAADQVSSITILGGPGAVSPSIVTTMTGDL